jgi:hypothetical protein
MVLTRAKAINKILEEAFFARAESDNDNKCMIGSIDYG